MDFNINTFKKEYLNYLNDSLTGKQLGDAFELTLPFYDRFNDALQVYIEHSKSNIEEYVITDDSYIVNSLIATGVTLSDKRRDTIESICHKVGIKLEGNTLVVQSSKKDLVSKVHALAQAMLRIDDMYLTSQSRVTSYFLEDIK